MSGESDKQIRERAVARIGVVLREKWRLDELCGIGGMAAVYAATHRNGKRAAIKILHPEAALIPDVRARFLREGYLANKVGHPGAVSILDDDVDADGNVYLVMELLEGESLDDRTKREERLPWAEVLLIADQVLSVLAAAHDKQIVHRDLKPGNVFVSTDGTVKILDFGIARLGAVAPSGDSTGPQVSLGTPGFMPPEQARGRSAEVDAQSDLWALGATMFAALSGQHVHEAETANEQLLQAMTKPAPPLAEVAPEVPPRAAELIDRALRFDKSERWTDARQMQAALREIYQELAGEPIQDAVRLNVPVVRASRSVRPDAPTLAASDSGADHRLTTTRPVSDRADATAPPAPRRRGVVVAAAAAAALLLLIGWRAISGDPEQPMEASSAEPVAAATAPAPPARDPAPVPSPEPAPAAPPSASASTVPAPPSASPPAKPRPPQPAARPQKPGSKEIDIFTRRQ
jgi:eukaryotic-like serine/threonine-protein kinase